MLCEVFVDLRGGVDEGFFGRARYEASLGGQVGALVEESGNVGVVITVVVRDGDCGADGWGVGRGLVTDGLASFSGGGSGSLGVRLCADLCVEVRQVVEVVAFVAV